MTLHDVARRANVSPSTVSRVLNNLDIVKESTKQRVLKAVEELHYRPNLHARTLAGGKTRTLGMVVSNITNPFFTDIFCGLERTARQLGYEVVVEHTDYRVSRLVTSIRSMIAQRVSGLAVIVSEMEPSILHEIRESGVPVVYYDVGTPGPNATNIRVRYDVGMQRVVQYLYALGHRRMAYVGHHPSLSPLQVRQRAFLRTLQQYGAEVECKTVLSNDGPTGGIQAARELLASGFKPTAIVCVNDYMSLGLLKELRTQGMSVPGDVSVTGFDNIEFSEFTSPALTTLNIPRHAIGRMAVNVLLGEGVPTEQNEVIIDPELVLRDSTGPAKK